MRSDADIQRRPTRRRRLGAGAAGLLVMIVGLLVHAIDSGPVTNFTADALYAVLLYLAVTVAAPRLLPVQVGIIAGGLCVAIELFQLTGIPATLSDSVVFRLTLGTSFAAIDLVAYVVGVAAVACCDAVGNCAHSRRISAVAAIAASATARQQPE